MSLLPDPNTVRCDPCPDGYRYEWVPESAVGWMSWRVVAPSDAKRCRMTDFRVRCKAMSVARLNRGRKTDQWWHYCADHMYGRRVAGVRVWVIHTVKDEEQENP